MRGLIFVLMILAGLLVFGCVGTPSDGQAVQQQEQTQQTTEPTQEQTQQQQQATEKETTQETTQQQEGTTDGMDLGDLTYLELAALGVPIKCEVTSTYQEITTTATLYIVGEDKMRMEVPSEGRTMISLVLGETLYVKNVMAEMYPECEWLKIDYEETGETTGATEGGMTYESPTTELEDMPPQDFECEAWVYDASKFTAPTENVCTQEEFEAMIMEQYDVSEYQ